MTEQITTAARVHEILDCFGADATRWPDAERLAALALVTRDPALQRARRDAAAFDAVLTEWARRDLGAGTDAGRVAAEAMQVRRPWLRWVASGAVAAALGAGVMLAGPATRSVAPAETVHGSTTISAAAAFSTVFTPTPDEDDRI